jgi:hypothetical protein
MLSLQARVLTVTQSGRGLRWPFLRLLFTIAPPPSGHGTWHA